MYKAAIIADSLSPQGKRLTTFVVTYPRIVHAEMCRHGMLSRNTASSRAIPFKKMVKDVQENPFISIAWQKDHKGMQGTEYFTENDNTIPFIGFYGTQLYANKPLEAIEHEWLKARDKAIEFASNLNSIGVTKQLCNRLLEPFVWVTEIITGTEWENFFKLRCPQYTIHRVQPQDDYVTYLSWKDLCKDYPEMTKCTLLERLECNKSQAEIHIQAIAELMWDEFYSSTPKQLQAGEWHIPYGDNIDFDVLASNYGEDVAYDMMIKIATARCARISYETLGDNPKIDYEADIKLHNRLKEMEHMSPFEHVARAMSDEEYKSFHRGELADYTNTAEGYHPKSEESLGWCRNFNGFIQYRHLIES